MITNNYSFKKAIPVWEKGNEKAYTVLSFLYQR